MLHRGHERRTLWHRGKAQSRGGEKNTGKERGSSKNSVLKNQEERGREKFWTKGENAGRVTSTQKKEKVGRKRNVGFNCYSPFVIRKDQKEVRTKNLKKGFRFSERLARKKSQQDT